MECLVNKLKFPSDKTIEICIEYYKSILMLTEIINME